MTKKPTTGELRRKAEVQLLETNSKTGPLPTTEADTRRLVHELQVHQIELEIQNEELARSRAEVESLLQKYTDLYDFAPVSYFTLTENGTIEQVNLAGASLLGVARGKLIKRRFEGFVATESWTAFKVFLEKVFTSGRQEICEVILRVEGVGPLWVSIEAIREAEQHEVCRMVVMDVTESKLAEESLRHLSTHDALTGLYNRGYFMEEMARLERGRNFPVSIMMADTDHLKQTNDNFGHASGDDLLKRVAQALTATFRGEDVVARLGGDEFAVLLPGTSKTEADVLIDRLQEVIRKNNGAHMATPISLSLSVSTAKTPASLAGLLHEADTNMYREKREHNASEKDNFQKTS
jgi:diguanylate cyclase (GGDEF)-like protein/PAS domain S-box-containing protein